MEGRISQTNFWAVIVGIDTYDDAELALRGACEDALDMYQYVVSELGVAAEHVRVLLSSSAVYPNLRYDAATRNNILAALYDHLRDNPDIQIGDNILFYFSGHGARYSMSPADFPAVDRHRGSDPVYVEALCPADRSAHTPGPRLAPGFPSKTRPKQNPPVPSLSQPRRAPAFRTRQNLRIRY